MNDSNESPKGGGEPQKSRWRLPRWVQFVLPPLLTAGAVGAHWVINVPELPIKTSPREQGKKKKGRKGKGVRKHTPRGPKKIKRLRNKYRSVDIEEEPVAAAWARAHQALVNKAVVVARNHAFRGAPESPQVILTQTTCRTIRCRFILRGPFPYEVTMLSDTMQELIADDTELWHSYQANEIPPPSDGSPTDEHYLEVVVSFARDGIESGSIAIGGEESSADAGAAEPGVDPARPKAPGRGVTTDPPGKGPAAGGPSEKGSDDG